eukprot:2205202-Pyramimonas_sp.AAC.1
MKTQSVALEPRVRGGGNTSQPTRPSQGYWVNNTSLHSSRNLRLVSSSNAPSTRSVREELVIFTALNTALNTAPAGVPRISPSWGSPAGVAPRHPPRNVPAVCPCYATRPTCRSRHAHSKCQ